MLWQPRLVHSVADVVYYINNSIWFVLAACFRFVLRIHATFNINAKTHAKTDLQPCARIMMWWWTILIGTTDCYWNPWKAYRISLGALVGALTSVCMYHTGLFYEMMSKQKLVWRNDEATTRELAQALSRILLHGVARIAPASNDSTSSRASWCRWIETGVEAGGFPLSCHAKPNQRSAIKRKSMEICDQWKRQASTRRKTTICHIARERVCQTQKQIGE